MVIELIVIIAEWRYRSCSPLQSKLTQTLLTEEVTGPAIGMKDVLTHTPAAFTHTHTHTYTHTHTPQKRVTPLTTSIQSKKYVFGAAEIADTQRKKH